MQILRLASTIGDKVHMEFQDVRLTIWRIRVWLKLAAVSHDVVHLLRVINALLELQEHPEEHDLRDLSMEIGTLMKLFSRKELELAHAEYLSFGNQSCPLLQVVTD